MARTKEFDPDLYPKACDRYLGSRDPIVERLSQPGPVLPAVRALVRAYAEESVRDRRASWWSTARSSRPPPGTSRRAGTPWRPR